jgi:2-amino-4-hydroxy-6-hydroxymethyldihydropteridine diphosphokinase
MGDPRDTPATRVAVALGSNLGDRHANLRLAFDQLAELLHGLRVSSFRMTDAVGVGPQPAFLNGAITGLTRLDPAALLDALLAIEARSGRERPWPGAPRTLDLDLILHGDAILERPGLIVPHPRFRQRAFVLEPLAEIAPEMVDPVTGTTVGRLWAERVEKNAQDAAG